MILSGWEAYLKSWETDMQFHVQHFDSNEVWPKGGWSLYKIDGDEIANRTIRERVNPKGWYEGEVIARHPWCGYIGCFDNLEQVMKAMEKTQ